MKEVDEKTLDAAIALGDAVCNELGICCEKRGQGIFQVYKKLKELEPKKDITVTQQLDEAKAE